MTPPEEPTVEDPGIPQRDKPPMWKRLLKGAVTILVLVLVLWFASKELDFGEVVNYLGNISITLWGLLAIIAGWFLVAYVFVFMATLPSLRFREGFVAQTTATAINNTLPAGGAIALPITYSQFMSWGFTPEAVTAGLLTAGVWDQLARLALPVLAVGLVAITGDATWWMWLVSVGGVVVVAGAVWLIALILRSETAAEKLGGWLNRMVAWVMKKIHRDPIDMVSATLQFRDNVLQVAEHRWKAVTAATVANHASMAALFLVSLRAVGIASSDVSAAWILLAFALGRLLVMIPISPGGLGLVDLGFIGLVTLGWGAGADANIIAAGVVLYRMLSYLPPVIIGVGSWVFWRVNKSWRLDWHTAARGEASTP